MSVKAVDTQPQPTGSVGARRIARRIGISGVVQGVGFRPFVYTLARDKGVTGWVLNHSGGVDIEAEGPADAVGSFVTELRTKAPPIASIESLKVRPIDVQGFTDFRIRHSERQEGRYQLISPDVATCPDCLGELLDPDDRRYRYPFINCTNCGPRFTIIEDIPYDRANTTMRVFPMCDLCRAEYEDPANRRFHAQPNACPVCGPHVWLVERAVRRDASRVSGDEARLTVDEPTQSVDGVQHQVARIQPPVADEALRRAADLLLAGHILAIKGLGGFHLACDATNARAVATLRERKHRPHKPLAVMVATPDRVRELCRLPAATASAAAAEALLTSPQCPIVLLEAKAGIPVAANVAPNSHTLGVMVAYTPLHHILLRDVGRPLVMTSGNLSEEPIAKDNDEALRRLAPLADAFLMHNRDIYARYDDSVVMVLDDESTMRRDDSRLAIPAPVPQRLKTQDSLPESSVLSLESPSSGQYPAASHRLPAAGFQLPNRTPVRRARGYAPFPVRLPFAVPQVLAVGPFLKNTFTLTRDRYAFISQHIGDLESLETLDHYEAALATYRHLFRTEPEMVASDLHPDYLSTRLATEYAEKHSLPAPLRLQHHKAHIAGCLADQGWPPDAGPIIGVALDGTGYGEDGHIWGGEWFVGDYGGFERVAHLDYLPLPGGDAAIRHPWRTAVAYIHALGLNEAMPLGEFCPADVMRVRTMVNRQLNTPLTSSMGRLFDAVSALLGVCHESTYEAQAAIELEQLATTLVADGAMPAAYPFDLDVSVVPNRVKIDTLLDAILSDLALGERAPMIALRFHTTVAAMIVSVCAQLREDYDIHTVALSGGVFQNRLLNGLALARLTAEGLGVLFHHQVPPNDGGVSLGQAALAGFAKNQE